MHPLEYIASHNWMTKCGQGRKLDLETLTVWLAESAGQPYLRIDPLKIDVAAITPLMSYAFAQRHKIIGVAVDSGKRYHCRVRSLLSAVGKLIFSPCIRRPIKRVVANPADIQRFTTEFYRLARSVSGAATGDQVRQRCRKLWGSY